MSNIRAVVITVSDACSRGEREDTSGAALNNCLRIWARLLWIARFFQMISSHWPRH